MTKFFTFACILLMMIGCNPKTNEGGQSSSNTDATTTTVEVGKAAPDFTLKGQNGKEHKLSDFKGKLVVLEWFNKDCPFVKKFYDGGDMQKLQKEIVGKDIVWLSICSSAAGKQGHLESPEVAKSVYDEKKMGSTALLLDNDGKVGKVYNAKTTPHMYVIDKEGKLAYMGAIDSIKSTESADIEKAENYVRAAIDALNANKEVQTKETKPYGCGVKY